VLVDLLTELDELRLRRGQSRGAGEQPARARHTQASDLRSRAHRGGTEGADARAARGQFGALTPREGGSSSGRAPGADPRRTEPGAAPQPRSSRESLRPPVLAGSLLRLRGSGGLRISGARSRLGRGPTSRSDQTQTAASAAAKRASGPSEHGRVVGVRLGRLTALRGRASFSRRATLAGPNGFAACGMLG
jgi:hypothetical protein